ncbi:ABC-type nitrate/sulfonate/bicarbonate transport system substrate-binding protein [Rathayibacter sp. PhB93]|uniref:ABC transporter substrate-binding protein n=1 Tax=unclassified Rathayibacter TaxID=2609250 RepID=UPI000FBA0680|nr:MULTISPECIES: ABC transporter substrate-binding protein [unclassified Rathayibacter]ROQ03176.1 ABC-type nitrate/sulfonate/bicarbonate transport system substrate-binding protein [Rathayibacter sp. PhB93]TDQ08989.1 ABC-type nitrate/sulfonate/bicarbonate transport system substrate-binding protein [Rathayibacter sp. PhB1]
MPLSPFRTSQTFDRRSVLRMAGVAGLALGGVSVLASCASDSSGASAEDGGDLGTLKVQLSWIKNEEFAGEFFADSKGYYTEAGLAGVTLTAGPSTGTAELLSGSADVALSDAVSVGTVVANEQAPLKIIGATYQKNPFTVLSIATAGNIATPADLAGKKIGVQASNTSLFQALLKANGLAESDVTVVPVEYDPSVLINGTVDGFIAYLTNEAITVAAEGYEVVNLPFADNGLPFVAETFTVTDMAIADKREALKAFLVAEIKGWTDAVNDPEAGAMLALETYGKDLGLDEESSKKGSTIQSEELVVSDETVANGLFTISDSLQEETLASLSGAGIDVDAADLFDMSLLAEVYEENPDLVKYAA